MEIYPFFLECSKFVNDNRKRQLQKLAIGEGGLILKRKKEYILVADGFEFSIPNNFNHESYNKLCDILWPETEYNVVQKELIEIGKNWNLIKKKDKLSLIDEYIINTENSKKMKAIISIALLLKLLTNVEFVDGKIKSLCNDNKEISENIFIKNDLNQKSKMDKEIKNKLLNHKRKQESVDSYDD